MNLRSLTAAAILIAGRTKLEIAVNETTMTMAADTIPACTAACPRTSAPTIEIAGPIALGIRTPASRITSKVISMTSASSRAGRGVLSRCAAKAINKVVGSIS
ncbi:hypothetical protein D3C72_1322140 [compost metagenome]